MGNQSYDPNFGWEPSILEPFWVRKGWFWKRRWVPACYTCKLEFKDESDYARHWLQYHSTTEEFRE